MRCPLAALALSLLASMPLPAQATDAPQSYTLRTQSNVVLMPTQIETRQGEIVYGLKVSQFVVEDNGVKQQAHLDEDTDLLGLSLVVAVQCSRSAVMEYAKLRGLGTMIDAIAGGAPREVALVSYGKEPELLGDFSKSQDQFNVALNDLQPCDDKEAATLDAVAYSTNLLEQRQNHYRHAILLISETRDHGSAVKPEKVIADLGRSNTVVDSVAFSPGHNEIFGDLKHGGGSGPIGLLVMAVNAVKKNAAKELAQLSGGEYLPFTSDKNFDRNLQQLSNHIHNYYLLSFQPGADTATGMHSLRVTVPEYPDAVIRTRESYWAGQDSASPDKP